MNHWETIRRELEDLIHTPIRYVRTSPPADKRINKENHWFEVENQVWFPLSSSDEFFVIQAQELNPNDLKWIAFSINHLLQQKKEQSQTEWLRNWIMQMGDQETSKPGPSIVETLPKESELVYPFIVASNEELPATFEKDAIEVLESFFEERIWYVSLTSKQGLLILPEQVVQDGIVDGDHDTLQQAIYDVFASELSEELYIVYEEPTNFAQLPSTYQRLNDSLEIGLKYHPEQYIIRSTDFVLERLVENISLKEIERFLTREAKLMHALENAETRLMLQHFFQFGAHLSETAKALFIHRNTLIYRLDRFAQETYHDVRNYDDAITVKIAMLLLKKDSW